MSRTIVSGVPQVVGGCWIPQMEMIPLTDHDWGLWYTEQHIFIGDGLFVYDILIRCHPIIISMLIKLLIMILLFFGRGFVLCQSIFSYELLYPIQPPRNRWRSWADFNRAAVHPWPSETHWFLLPRAWSILTCCWKATAALFADGNLIFYFF